MMLPHEHKHVVAVSFLRRPGFLLCATNSAVRGTRTFSTQPAQSQRGRPRARALLYKSQRTPSEEGWSVGGSLSVRARSLFVNYCAATATAYCYCDLLTHLVRRQIWKMQKHSRVPHIHVVAVFHFADTKDVAACR